MARVTVITAIYNHANYLETCLESILMQKTDFPFQVMLIDDASSDGSSDIVRAYAEKYPDIFIPVINETNLGVVESVFRATAGKIKTDYHAALEGDDFWTDENKLQMQVDLLDAHPDIDFCGHQTATHHVGQDKPDDVIIKETYEDEVVILEGLKNVIRPHTCSRIYRNKYDFSDVTEKAGVIYDTCIYWYFILHNPKMIYINKTMSSYNIHDTGMFSGAKKKARKYQGLFAINALNKVTEYKFESFNFKRFLKALPKKNKLPFLVKYMLSSNKQDAYDVMLEKYRS